MLIGNTWIKGAWLRILNAFAVVPAATAFVTFPETLQLNNKEQGFIVGFQQLGGSSAGGILNFQITFDGKAAHEGFFRSSTDTIEARIGNRQPTTMGMPLLDVPPDTEIGMRARFQTGVGVNMFLDLYVISYYIEEQEDVKAPTCFTTSGNPLDCV